jgi:hypothetical protein
MINLSLSHPHPPPSKGRESKNKFRVSLPLHPETVSQFAEPVIPDELCPVERDPESSESSI